MSEPTKQQNIIERAKDKGLGLFSSEDSLLETLGDLVILCESQQRKLDAKQAQIDALMFEWCPDEMTPEQIAEYEKNIAPAGGPWHCDQHGGHGFVSDCVDCAQQAITTIKEET